MMTGLGERMSDEDAEEMLREGDLDGDGVWRNVDLATWRVPEPVSYMPPVDLRANWVVETSWVLDSTTCAQPQP